MLLQISYNISYHLLVIFHSFVGVGIVNTTATFTSDDDVKAGKKYECRVGLSAQVDGNWLLSGNSEPSFITSQELGN